MEDLGCHGQRRVLGLDRRNHRQHRALQDELGRDGVVGVVFVDPIREDQVGLAGAQRVDQLEAHGLRVVEVLIRLAQADVVGAQGAGHRAHLALAHRGDHFIGRLGVEREALVAVRGADEGDVVAALAAVLDQGPQRAGLVILVGANVDDVHGYFSIR